MNQDIFKQVEQIIKNRRTTKAHAMNGKVIPDEQVQQLLELADYAPNHGQTEPWRFVVLSGEALDAFGQTHADIYWNYTDEGKRKKSKCKKYKRYADNASHVIAVAMEAGTNPKIPVKEERSAVSAAVQNMLLGATALGLASYWSTGGMTYHPRLKAYVGFDEQETMIGTVYLGYADKLRKQKKRRIPLEEKIVWHDKNPISA